MTHLCKSPFPNLSVCASAAEGAEVNVYLKERFKLQFNVDD